MPLVALGFVGHGPEPVLPSLSIVIPAYNEAVSIEASVRDALEVGAAHAGALEVIDPGRVAASLVLGAPAPRLPIPDVER